MGGHANIQPITEAFFNMQGNKAFLGIVGQTHGFNPPVGANNADSLGRATDGPLLPGSSENSSQRNS